MRFITVLASLLLAVTAFGQSIVTPVFVHKDGEASASGYSGSQKDICVDGGSQQSVGWITFQTSGIDFSKIASAKLMLYVKSLTNPGTLIVRLLTSDITEPENNVPMGSILTSGAAAATASLSTTNVENMLQIDITSAIKDGSFVGVALTSDDGVCATFDSKEGHLAPVILLTHSVDNVAAKWLSGTTAPAGTLGMDGDYYLNTTSGDVSVKSSGAWAVVTNIVGPTGSQGPKGDKGDTGPAGAAGATGPQGPQGSAGPTGATGETGAKGEQGIQGLPGLPGLTGATGPQGPAGADGKSINWRGSWNTDTIYSANDAVNYSGSSYLAIKGSTNKSPADSITYWNLMASKGDQGLLGPTGSIGPIGPQGPTGLTGIQGPKGEKGDAGTSSWKDSIGQVTTSQFVGIGLVKPGEKLHIADGHILVEGGGETQLMFKRDISYSGGPSGTSSNPIFHLGRITQAGDGDPEWRVLFSDDFTTERSVFEFDRKGIVASVKPNLGSHFEGFLLNEAEPRFRLNSFPKMQLEFGNGKDLTDVEIRRDTTKTLTIRTGQIERVRIDSSGNVGIAIDKPSAKLHIKGNIKIDSTGNGIFFPDGSKQTKAASTAWLIVPDNYVSITQAIDSLPANGGTVFVRAGLYMLSKGIKISRSNVTLLGEMGSVLKLSPSVNQPVVSIGTDAEIPTVVTSNIHIHNFEIDGNRLAQSSETDPTRTWIRNNCIDVRKVTGLWIDNINAHDAISGGLVISWNSSKVFVSHSSFHKNRYDGIALYTSDYIQISDFFSYENLAAGLSLDNDLLNVIFSNGQIMDNTSVGIFIRHSKDLLFTNLKIAHNGEDGCFMSHETIGSNSGVSRLCFSSCSFLDNARNGVWLASPSTESPQNTVMSCLFSGNAADAIKVETGGIIFQQGNVVQ